MRVTKTIMQAEFELADLGGVHTLTVTAVPDSTPAVEFLLHSPKYVWATQVVALRQGESIAIPAATINEPLFVRFFDAIGSELGSEVDRRLPLAGSTTAESASRKKPVGTTAAVALLLGVAGYFAIVGPQGTTKNADTAAGRASEDTAKLRPLSVISPSANLRAAPVVSKDNVLSVLPFGTELSILRTTGDFIEVQPYGGQRGFVHKNIVGPTHRVKDLGSKDAISQANSVSEERATPLLKATKQLETRILLASLFAEPVESDLDDKLRLAVSAVTRDEVASRYFHFLAEEASARRNFQDASAFYRGASLSDPTSFADIHGWGISQIKSGKIVDFNIVKLAVAVAPRSANTWILAAAATSKATPAGALAEERTLAALKLALELSTNRDTARKFLTELSRSAQTDATLKASIKKLLEPS